MLSHLLIEDLFHNLPFFSHAKQLIEDTIRRNASPVREHGVTVGGQLLTGSSSSINSSASDDSALPHSARASRALLHSLSTNDANIGEYKFTVVTGGHTIKITGDNFDLVRVGFAFATRKVALITSAACTDEHNHIFSHFLLVTFHFFNY